MVLGVLVKPREMFNVWSDDDGYFLYEGFMSEREADGERAFYCDGSVDRWERYRVREVCPCLTGQPLGDCKLCDYL